MTQTACSILRGTFVSCDVFKFVTSLVLRGFLSLNTC